MPYKDLHSAPFDETTITKLEIFEDYAEAWLPTFAMQPNVSEIHLFDFFAGPGFDRNGIPGTPIRLLSKIKSFSSYFIDSKTKVVLHLNEFEPTKTKQEKYELLKQNGSEYFLSNSELGSFVSIEYYNESAETLFFRLLPKIKKYPSLIYLDQNGVKFISKKFIIELEKLNRVDFLYFVSSSYFWRLGETEEFRKVLELDMQELKKLGYKNIHRAVIAALKKDLPSNTELKLFPFSLKKGANIYGIIFGAKHFRAVDKFLHLAWRRNATNGEADFDIDEDAKKMQIDIFEKRKMTKVEKFKMDVKERLLDQTLTNNEEVLIFTYEMGHIPGHSAEVVRNLKASKIINFPGHSPGITYDTVFKKKKKLTYSIV